MCNMYVKFVIFHFLHLFHYYQLFHVSSFENSLDPDQLASEKPADQDSNCFHCIQKHANNWTPVS